MGAKAIPACVRRVPHSFAFLANEWADRRLISLVPPRTGMMYPCRESFMTANPLNRRLTELEAARYRFGPGEAARVIKLLKSLDASRFPDPSSLIRFHEALLFLHAFPQSPAVVRITERVLNSFHKKVEALRKSSADMDAFDPLEVSGIAGTQMEDTLSFDVASWLIQRMPGKVETAWENYDPERELGTTGPRFIPLLEDDAYVEADTPWRRWLEAASDLHRVREDPSVRLSAGQRAGYIAAKRRKNAAHGVSRGYQGEMAEPHGGERRLLAPAQKDSTAAWLIGCFEDLPLPPIQKAELYESLRVPLLWNLENSSVSRTRNWKPARNVFYHDAPLIQRSEVSLARELAKRPPTLTKLPRRQGEAVIHTIREIMLVRYRELYGTTLGDPSSVVRADLGRGVSIFLWNLPPARRLPLRAYVAGFTLKNGMPINYIESIALCEWMEVGFNTFYTFRGGEVGWIYAQVLRCLCHLMGTTCVSVYPYQLGHDNEEAIESGAFWFYRKLGFRPGRPDLQRLVQREERRIAADPKYRTPARTLRRLAAGHVFYELPGSQVGAWDNFSTRNLGLLVNRRMAREFGGDSRRIRAASARSVARALGVKTSSLTAAEQATLEDFALVLALIPDLSSWTQDEKQLIVRIIRAKSKPDEMLYLHLLQNHARLRDSLLRLGS
jgi:hypothetical protein